MATLKIDPKIQPTVVSALYEYAKVLRTDVVAMERGVGGMPDDGARAVELIKDFNDRADKLDALAVELENS